MGPLKQIICLIVLLLSVTVKAQLSPGDLSEVHEHLEGLTNCTSCHKLGEGPSAEKCLDCHKVLNGILEKRKGLHNIYINVDENHCGDCHSEHAGKDFEMIMWPEGEKEFNHNSIGFQFLGRHKEIQCRDCHNPVFIKKDLKEIESGINLIKTYFGLDSNCLSCHLDEHRNQLGNDCMKCHNQNHWKPVVNFSHDNTKFVLTGKHTDVVCQKCHKLLLDPKPPHKRDTTYNKFIGLEFKNCTNCHKDKHDNKFGQDCDRCHVTNGWKVLDQRNVDHSKTNFPLLGKHADLKCDNCHKPNVRFTNDDFDQCLDCHKDTHNNQFTNRIDNGVCVSCHSVNGFLPALFTLEDHNKTEFKLVGAHIAQPCFVCHEMVNLDNKSYRNFKPPERLCQDCHKDPHQGQFANSIPAKQCQVCHKVISWKEINFEHNRDTKYPLEGAHKKVICTGCHKTNKNSDQEFIVYKPIDTKCKSCHAGEMKALN